MAIGKRTDPYRAFNFRLEIDGLTAGSFSECTGLSSKVDEVSYREGTDVPLTARKLIGQFKPDDVTLRRGVTQNTELWDWYRNITNGIADRRNASIILMDEQRRDVMCWNIYNAFLKSIEGPKLTAGGNEVAIESIVLAHEHLTLES